MAGARRSASPQHATHTHKHRLETWLRVFEEGIREAETLLSDMARRQPFEPAVLLWYGRFLLNYRVDCDKGRHLLGKHAALK